jgi:hypothetical protein
LRSEFDLEEALVELLEVKGSRIETTAAPVEQPVLFLMSGIDDRVEELDVAGYAANIFRRTGIATGQTDGRAQLRATGLQPATIPLACRVLISTEY